MAPGRRKGAGRGSSAAAARKQYKVGDLVLAKVKGFPAWPATVSEPEKWGYSNDWKKVLVYFFGTKQIGFCNPADVEAFTEEKKKTLLLKRQGKGADFVRAVDEIIDSYEKSKKQNQDESNSGDEGTVSNAGSLDGSKGKSWVKSPTQSPAPMHEPQSETPHSSIVRSDSCNPIEIPVPSKEITDPHCMQTESEEPAKNTSSQDLREAPSSIPKLLRKRSRETPLQSCVIQRRPVAVRRSRSSSRVEHSKFPKPVMPVMDGISHEPIGRNKLIRKSPDHSTCHDIDSLACSAATVSNWSDEDIGSEALAMESEAVSLNKGSTIESGGKIEHSGVVSEDFENGVELSGRLELQTTAGVLKKKRKPNRKRVTHDTETCLKLEKETSLEVVGSIKNLPTSPNDWERSSERFHKADGDEHLPLVKRARARMGKLCAETKQVDDSVYTKETSVQEALMNHSGKCTMAFSHDDNCPADSTSLGVKEAVNNSSPSKSFTHFAENDPELWKTKKYHLRGGSVDGEAALPPSKRLHRALEAMSANVAEATYAEDPRPTEILSNGCRTPNESTFLCAAADNRVGSTIEKWDAHSSGNDTSHDSTSGLALISAPPNPEEITKISSDAKPGDMLCGNYSFPKHEDCKEVLIEAGNYADAIHFDGSSIKTAKNKIHVENPQPCSSQCDEQGNIKPSQSASKQSSHVTEDGNKKFLVPSKEPTDDAFKGEGDYYQADKSDGEHEILEPISQRLDSVSKAEDVGSLLPLNGTGMPLSDADGGCPTTKTLRSQSDENSKVREMCEVEKEVKGKRMPKDRDAYLDLTSMKALIAAAQAKRHFSRSTSISDNASDDKVSFDAVSSSPPVHVINSSERASPTNALMHHVPALDDGNGIPVNGRSPGASAHRKNSMHVLDMDEERRFDSMSIHRLKPIGKWTGQAEANVVWKSFEAVLGTLSRTKESIGRATRLAIDCAKYGIAGEVVELLLHNLESESSLHRRVDLFFLVDSIIQCSRGQRGGIGDMFLSAVQPVLPRLLSAAAPPGNAARENRRQCLKVLKLWLERKTFPESIVRHHMRELDSNDGSFTSSFSRRPSRTERSLNDPIREMEGMLVDEYGSNTSFQLPGFVMPRMIDDDEEEDATDEKSFEAVTPEQNSGNGDEQATSAFATEKHPHILEDVDGELEMEDVSPSCEAEMNSGHNVMGTDTVLSSHCQFDQRPLPFAPPLPEEMPPSPPPLPSSPPPGAPPPPPPPPPSALTHPSADTMDSQHYQSANSMQSHVPQSVSQQPNVPNTNSTSLDTGPYYAPGYRDVSTQMTTPVSSYSSSSYSGFSSHPSMPTGNDMQQLGGATLPNKAHHLHPPPPTVSNQFSYVRADTHQRAESWMGCSSSHSAKNSQFGHEALSEHSYSHRGRMGPSQHEIDERRRFSAPVHSAGPGHPNKAEASYAPVPYRRPPSEHAPISNSGWSIPSRGLNYRHPVTTLRPPQDNQISGANGASNFWRPR
ncbi:protein HUA2-LIKE 2-like [Magnolia sinica]|uniref:protein HUA2-LIKE 2-like n=1 Tax=Magnolia sinica TaxID=86752 RepID=UPI002657BDC4|nr:protein HUA2-LIKE 2-like [Magnolia sinica]XP_058077803.1 protein HUA2-LIKE 2-like [Magnolia sinica]